MTSSGGIGHLCWDSDLMGFPVGQLEPSMLNGSTLSDIRERCLSMRLRLAYIALPWTDLVLRKKACALGAGLVDKKIIYSRSFDVSKCWMPTDLVSFEGMEPGPELESLALASGVYSRFRTDPRMAPSVFQNLYLTWIRRSVRREIADIVMVAKGSECLAGMVTVALREDHAEIGLLAVSESSRGQGIGKRLIKGAEAWALSTGVKRMTVATQGANFPACALYESMCYESVQTQAIYHYWVDSLQEASS